MMHWLKIGCVEVDIRIEQYDNFYLLDKHAPKNNIYVVDRPLNEWMTDLTEHSFRNQISDLN